MRPIFPPITSVPGAPPGKNVRKSWASVQIARVKVVSAGDRLAHSSVPYRLVEGTEVASGWDDLTDGQLANSINGGSPSPDGAAAGRGGDAKFKRARRAFAKKYHPNNIA